MGAGTAIPGLTIVPNFITPGEEQALLTCIGTSPHKDRVSQFRERILRYGPGVDASGYSSGKVSDDIPRWLRPLVERVWLQGHRPNAITINEYLPTQGIDFHTDSVQAGPVITTLSLAGRATMGMRNNRETFDIELAPRTLVQLAGACRKEPWRHAIYPVKELRYSIVFRWAKE